MTRGGCQETRHSLGAYVLGALDPVERAAVDSHLAACRACREDLAGLAGVAALLRRVPLAEAERLTSGDPDSGPLDSGDALLARTLARAATLRRARRRRALAAVAAAVAVAGGAGAAAGLLAGQRAGGQPPAAVSSPPTAAGTWRTVTGAGPGAGVALTVRYRPTAWGTGMDVQVSGVRPGTACQLEVVDDAGRKQVAGGWTVDAGEWSAWYPASTSLAFGRIRGFSVVAGDTVVARAVVG